MSKRFHDLVTTPHAWRIAFARFFPGAEALSTLDGLSDVSMGSETLQSERRVFTRLTALASWRSEYILRTRLLRSLGRGKPGESHGQCVSGSSRPGNSGSAHITYNSNLITIIDHLHATFENGSQKKLPRFIHGASDIGMASFSEPRNGKIDQWGFSDPFGPQQFADLFPGDALYGLGAGDVVGVPNVMDISQPYGMIYAEGLPNGRVYYRSSQEKRGRSLSRPQDQTVFKLDIPACLPSDAMCSVWIAKAPSISDLTDGLMGMFVGSSHGILSSHSLGTNSVIGRRLERGEVSARWAICPGVPIIAIAVDENITAKRQTLGRIWAVVLNALGEIFYLTAFPTRRLLDRALRLDGNYLEELAWETGRTVYWTLVEPTRRTARPDPFNRPDIDGSYTPRTSWNGLGLSKEQIIAETKEINSFIQKKPKDFHKSCVGWDMRRRLEVDFAASNEDGVGEGIMVIDCGLDEGSLSEIKRYTRCRFKETIDGLFCEPRSPGSVVSPDDTGPLSKPFAISLPAEEQPTWSFIDRDTTRRSSAARLGSAFLTPQIEEWRVSVFAFDGLKLPQITATAIDVSKFAVLTADEDPLLYMSGSSTASSPVASPSSQTSNPGVYTEVPGQRARFLAAGTSTGAILLWNVRAPTASNALVENAVNPIRIIYTDSPQISCLALTALYLVHGGNDGLVQAWDPLASSTDPLRTLNSRFSSRARRRLVQAEASPAGVGINLFAAGAIFLDPDTTVLRGMVSLGSHLRYWSYSSQPLDNYKGSKRRARRSERSSNQGADKFSGNGRGALKDYIANEKLELEREKRNKRKEEERLTGRFGTDLLGPEATEDEILAYATLLSEEAAEHDELRRKSVSEKGSSYKTVNHEAIDTHSSPALHEDEIDPDVAEAIRQSLNTGNESVPSIVVDGEPSSSQFTMKYANKKGQSAGSPPRKHASAPPAYEEEVAGTSAGEMDDLNFALQLSQVEEESRMEKASGGSKGKDRAL